MSSKGQALPPGLRILFVEDEPLIAMYGEATLLEFGVAHVLIAHTVAEAERAMEAEDLDMAILDFKLGGETSVALAQRLQGLGLPFGFLTGYAGNGIPDAFRDRPILTKPFTSSELLGLVRRLVGCTPGTV